MKSKRFSLYAASLMIAACSCGAQTLIHEENMAELKCAMPNENIKFAGSSAPGQLFFNDEPVNLKLAIKRGDRKGEVAYSFIMQEIGTRTPGKNVKSMKGWNDTSGHAPIVDLIGQPAPFDFKVSFTDAEWATPEVQNVPLPKRFGTYAIVLLPPPEGPTSATRCP